jgi:hypothetical protein
MNSLYRIPLIAATLYPFTCGAYGQVSVSVQSASGQPLTMTARLPRPSQGQVVTGMPYSAEEVSDHIQTLADGTHITQKPLATKVFRDSQGRSRTERHLFRGANGDDLTIVEIVDPVSGFGYILDPYNHVAHRFAPPEAGGGKHVTAASSGSARSHRACSYPCAASNGSSGGFHGVARFTNH